ncbi:MAG: aspartate kinase [Bacteroidetes bacterium]|nr:aspartate kinase [Bacteroidota bacterium]
MITVSQIVDNIVSNKPFLEQSLAEELINYSSLARSIQAEIELRIGRSIKTSAIIMALKRYVPQVDHLLNIQLERAAGSFGDITVRSQLTDYTFRISPTLVKNQQNLLKILTEQEEVFFTFSQGVYELNVVISSIFSDKLEEIFSGENMTSRLDNLSSVTMRLPISNVKMTGLYYHILKKIAWNNINIIEIISTTNEFTVIVEEKYVGDTFIVLKNLNNRVYKGD